MPKEKIGEKNAPVAAVVIGVIAVLFSSSAGEYSTAITIIGGGLGALGVFGLLQQT